MVLVFKKGYKKNSDFDLSKVHEKTRVAQWQCQTGVKGITRSTAVKLHTLRATRVWIFHAEILPKKCVFSVWKIHKKPVEGVTKFDTTMWEIHRKMWFIYLITVVKNVENTQNNSIISFSTCKLTNKTRNMLPLTTNSNISIIHPQPRT